jgi:uncharacterized membrane protein YfcA
LTSWRNRHNQAVLASNALATEPVPNPLANKYRPRKGLLAGVAALIAFASTLLGIGGGAFLVPAISTWGGLRLKRAVGTSLAVITVVTAVGLLVQVFRAPGDILWAEAGLLVCGALAGGPVGAWLIRVLPRRMFRFVLAAFFVLVSIRMAGLIPHATRVVGEMPDLTQVSTIFYLLGAGFFAGISATAFGIGGGIVIVPALMIGYGALSDNFAVARATSLAAIVPIGIWATFLHMRRGNIKFALVPVMLPLSIGMAVFGVFAAYWVRPDILTLVFAILLSIMAVKVALEKPRAWMPEDDEQKSS